ncbi:hypothetical protein EXIGLDRAFT_593330, partial [Exidia glandulosa HHB12029]
AGLFSAVTTTFIIESYKLMLPDYTELTFRAMITNASYAASLLESFETPRSARAVNCVWITSLVLSLSAALIAIMGKDWIAMYPTQPTHSLRKWAAVRHFRFSCVSRWHMPGVIASAPILLHLSLLLFAVGLVIFFIPIDFFTAILSTVLTATLALLYAITALSPVV